VGHGNDLEGKSPLQQVAGEKGFLGLGSNGTKEEEAAIGGPVGIQVAGLPFELAGFHADDSDQFHLTGHGVAGDALLVGEIDDAGDWFGISVAGERGEEQIVDDDNGQSGIAADGRYLPFTGCS
jgi:hypothetical protein